MKCSNCGTDNEISAKFCNSCGFNLIKNEEKSNDYSDTKMITNTLSLMLYLFLLYDLIIVSVNIYKYNLLKSFEDTTTFIDSIESKMNIINHYVYIVDDISVILSLSIMLTFLFWIFKTNKNSKVLGARDMKYSPVWSVLWFFIPIFNLWKPIQVMKELYYTSLEPRSWKQVILEIKTLHQEKSIFDWKSLENKIKKSILMDGMIGSWWVIIIIIYFITFQSLYQAKSSNIPNDLMEISVDILTYSLDFISTYLLIIIVKTIYTKQVENCSTKSN